jgi:hypothetical protein
MEASRGQAETFKNESIVAPFANNVDRFSVAHVSNGNAFNSSLVYPASTIA